MSVAAVPSVAKSLKPSPTSVAAIGTAERFSA